MLLIFVPVITHRIEYVFKHIFTEISGIDFTFTTDKELFSSSAQPKISYNDAPLGNEMFFYADVLLGQSEILPLIPETGNFQNTITLFPNNNEASALPYDIFSAVFYMLSRYEEYLQSRGINWLSLKSTIEYIGEWELLYNPVFNYTEFGTIKNDKNFR